jgi:hypothetical protein
LTNAKRPADHTEVETTITFSIEGTLTPEFCDELEYVITKCIIDHLGASRDVSDIMFETQTWPKQEEK